MLASNNLFGSFALSKFAGHGKPGICVSFVQIPNATAAQLIQWYRESENIIDTHKNPTTATKISPESRASIRQHTAKICTQYHKKGPSVQAKPSYLETPLTTDSRKQQLSQPRLQRCLISSLNTTRQTLAERLANLTEQRAPLQVTHGLRSGPARGSDSRQEQSRDTASPTDLP